MSTSLESVTQDANRVTAHTLCGQDFEGDYLIGADGIHSKARESLGIEYHSHELPNAWSIADVELQDFSHVSSATVFVLKKGKLQL